MTARAVIFDLDGTLIDSLQDIAQAMNDALKEARLPTHDTAAYPAFVGKGVDHLVRCALPSGEVDRLAEFREAFQRHYRTGETALAKPYDGILEAMATLRNRGIPAAVLSNKRQAPCEALVRRFFSHEHFVEVCGERPGVPMKPDPSEAVRLCGQLGVKPADCYFVGDTETDVRTALRAGCVATAVTWGFRSRTDLQTAGATRFVEHPDELPAVIR